MYDDDDIVVEGRSKHKKNKWEDEDWYPYDTPEKYTKPTLMMAPRKKWELDEYNFKRSQFENEQKSQNLVKNYLEDQYIPRDIVDEILTKAGFYIPRVIVFGRKSI